MWKWVLSLLFLILCGSAYSQVPADSLKADSIRIKTLHHPKPSADLNKQYDFSNLMQNIFHPHEKTPVTHNPSGITVVPNVAANPTIGAQAGIKAVAGKKLGNDSNTLFSIAATSASITTKGIIYFYLNHNLFTPGNKWNFQGNLVIAKTVTPDYGLGIGRGLSAGSFTDSVLADPAHKVHAVHSH